ncbi:MAG TPA: hypothetical protein VM537_05725 [Anaerolineae bacterium]|nr:hypothetical protein [Anaerolineae bacterium]
MNSKLHEDNKVDVGVAPSDAGDTPLSPYYSMAHYRKMLIAAQVASLAEGQAIQLCVFEARNAAALGAQQIGATQTFTQGINATQVIALLTNVIVDDTITINGLVYRAAAVADYPNRVFDQSGNDAATAASLVLAINHATAGVPGVTATSINAWVTLVSTVPGVTLISTSETGGATIFLLDTQQVGIFEVDGSKVTNGYSHIAHGFFGGVQAIYVASLVVRQHERYGADPQAVAFSAEA